MRRASAALALALLSCRPRPAPEPPPPPASPTSPRVAVYRDGDPRLRREQRVVRRSDGTTVSLPPRRFAPARALVWWRQELDLAAGRSRVALPRVPLSSDPTSLWIGGAGVSLVGQIRRPLEARGAGLLGRRVRAQAGGALIEGELAAIDGERALVRDAGGHSWVVPRGAVTAAARGAGAGVTAELEVARGGRQLVELAYATSAIDWRVDYALRLPAQAGRRTAVELSPMVTVENRGEADLASARFELFEGMPGRSAPPRRVWRGSLDVGPRARVQVPLPRRRLFGAVEVRYRGFAGDLAAAADEPSWGTASKSELERVLRLEAAAGLPMGKAIVQSGTVPIAADFEPRPGQPVELVLGPARQLFGTRRQVRVRRTARGLEESYELSVLNRRAVPVAVRLEEPLRPGLRATIVSSEPAASRRGSRLEVALDVPPMSRRAARFTLRYRTR